MRAEAGLWAGIGAANISDNAEHVNVVKFIFNKVLRLLCFYFQIKKSPLIIHIFKIL